MAARRKPGRPKKSTDQFMILDSENNSCCGQGFDTYVKALAEAKSHMGEEVNYSDCCDDYHIVKVVARLEAKPKDVEIIEHKV